MQVHTVLFPKSSRVWKTASFSATPESEWIIVQRQSGIQSYSLTGQRRGNISLAAAFSSKTFSLSILSAFFHRGLCSILSISFSSAMRGRLKGEAVDRSIVKCEAWSGRKGNHGDTENLGDTEAVLELRKGFFLIGS